MADMPGFVNKNTHGKPDDTILIGHMVVRVEKNRERVLMLFDMFTNFLDVF